MRVLAVNHGPLVRAENFGDVVREEGHELVGEAEEAYAFFNNNQTNGVAQAPAGAPLLRRPLEGDDVPVA